MKRARSLSVSLQGNTPQTLNQIFSVFAKIGAFTIGGGAAMIPIIEKEVVEKHKWLTSEEFLDIIAIAQSAPGLIAVNVSIFVGHKICGVRGSIIATLGSILPPFIIILMIAALFTNFQDNEIVLSIFKGIRPAVVALIAAPVIRIAIKNKLTIYKGAIILFTIIGIAFLGISPIWIIVAAILGSIIYSFVESKKFEK